MRRADRLLQIIQILNRETQPVTSSNLASELEVSQRTIYRDMLSLQSTGVPICGEAGIGYVLGEGYHLPPLMFNKSELEAIMLGARMVDGRVDDNMSRAARDVVAKIKMVIPNSFKHTLLDAPFFAPFWVEQPEEIFDIGELRDALRSESEIDIDYVDLKGIKTSRIIWPITIGLFPNCRIVSAFCTKRQDFRSFRTEKIVRFEVLESKMGKRRAFLLSQFRKTMLNFNNVEHNTGKISGI